MPGVAVTRDGKEAMLSFECTLVHCATRVSAGHPEGRRRSGPEPPDPEEGERHGADGCRLLAAQVAGEMSGTHVFTTEFETGEAWGE